MSANIETWSDYDLQTRDWRFPQTVTNIIKVTIRILLFFGYRVEPADWSVKQVKPLGRKEKGIWIGLYNEENYPKITQILAFLNKNEMFFLSVLFFRAMCEAMKTDPVFKQKVKKGSYLNAWMGTMPFLQKYKDTYDIEESMKTKKKQKVDHSVSESSNESNESRESGEISDCMSFRGLNYTGNSCYQDSTLLAMLAIPNTTISRYILLSDVREITELPKKWTVCSEDPETDYNLRKSIQDELIRISNSMRKVGKPVNTCSNLRKLISRCPGTEEFHGTGMQDAGEFVSYIFNLFQIDVATTSNTTYVTNDLNEEPKWLNIGKITDKQSSPIVAVLSGQIEDGKEKQINGFLVQVEDAVLDNSYVYEGKEYIRRRRVWKMETSPYLVFYIHRLHRTYDMINGKFKVKEKKLRTSVLPVQKIGKLSLSAIVVHSHNHYTCYISCRGIWFYFDDNPSGKSHAISRIGSYDDMLLRTPSPLKDGTLYFYT